MAVGLGARPTNWRRAIGRPLRETLGSRWSLETAGRRGGSAPTGREVEPDGYTFLMMSNTHTANETLLPNRPYQLLRDLTPVAAVNIAYNVLVVLPRCRRRRCQS